MRSLAGPIKIKENLPKSNIMKTELDRNETLPLDQLQKCLMRTEEFLRSLAGPIKIRENLLKSKHEMTKNMRRRKRKSSMMTSARRGRSLIKGQKCIVYVSIILQLLQLIYGLVCKKSGCVRDVLYTVHGRGTAVLVKWQCSGGHAGGKWWSQPKFKGVYAGNLHMASALIMSGNNFSKIHLMTKFFKLHCFSESSFYRYQRLFIAPAVAKYWSDMQRDQIPDLQGTSVIIAGDGRNDSPGHSAQYCTYSFLDASSGRILHVEVVDVREAAGKSTNMERIGFERGMAFLAGKVDVKTMVTDARPQIMAVMK